MSSKVLRRAAVLQGQTSWWRSRWTAEDLGRIFAMGRLGISSLKMLLQPGQCVYRMDNLRKTWRSLHCAVINRSQGSDRWWKQRVLGRVQSRRLQLLHEACTDGRCWGFARRCHVVALLSLLKMRGIQGCPGISWVCKVLQFENLFLEGQIWQASSASLPGFPFGLGSSSQMSKCSEIA